MVAEDAQGIGGQRTGADVEDGGEQLARDLVHVGNHEQQALRGRIGGGQGAALKRAVQCPGRSSLGLHFHHMDGLSEDVLSPLAGPCVHQFGHGGTGSDGEDGGHFREGIGDVGGGCVAVHCLRSAFRHGDSPQIALEK